MIKPAFGSCYSLIQRKWFSKLQFKSLKIRSDLFDYYYRDTYPRIWQNIALAFNVSIEKVEFNGKICYEIERINTKLYIDAKTYEPVGSVVNNNYTDLYDTTEKRTIAEETYNIKKDIVKDKDVQRPNIDGIKTYTLEELNKSYNNK